MRKQWKKILPLAFVLMLAFSGTVFAFRDLDGVQGKDKINELQKLGILKGVGADKFNPQSPLSYAEGIAMVVNGLNLNMDNIRTVKRPEPGDYFAHVPNNAWYAQAFNIAQYNGFDLPRDLQPGKTLTREQFADLLHKGILATGSYAFIEMWVQIADENAVTKTYMTAIQHLLVTRIASLDDTGSFRPKALITRAEAAVMLHRAVQFVKAQASQGSQTPPDGHPQDGVTMQIQKVTDQVNKVVLSWGEKPTTGYTVTVTSIQFKGDGTAVIRYRLHAPRPDEIVGQMITYPKAETFISSACKPVIERDPDSAQGQSGSSGPGSSGTLPPDGDTPVSNSNMN
ncbi:S-layer homology domain-containing protein [Ferviditalea candida]|uniref:S-layer homology domain-containing protein n=1 Tax=Ferviditalea candida TaxID=3108399 RepID=A0ABU5ZFC5_9BACL|nr:S-layer homology domain-containing protein [Paenibacillaceae bacterium T2]